MPRQKAAVAIAATVAAEAVTALARHARPIGDFNPARYFRADGVFRFRGVPMPAVRMLAREVARAHGERWKLAGALAFADVLIRSDYLEDKALGILVLARHRREFTPALLRRWRRWLSSGRSRNWATTDAICGYLIRPLLLTRPELIADVCRWAKARNLWVRRAAAVSLVGPAARGIALDEAYAVARQLEPSQEDLIHKAAGWLLREAGRTDPVRLRRYLLARGVSLPRTTLRYALERFPAEERRRLMRRLPPTRKARRQRNATVPSRP